MHERARLAADFLNQNGWRVDLAIMPMRPGHYWNITRAQDIIAAKDWNIIQTAISAGWQEETQNVPQTGAETGQGEG